MTSNFFTTILLTLSLFITSLSILLANPVNATQNDKHILFISGAPSHGFGNHEHHGGNTLLAATLEEALDGVRTTVVRGWPEDESIFDDVAAVVIFANGAGGHVILPHMDSFQEVIDRGVGFVTLHFAVEVPTGEPGDKFLEWQGGYFETHWSVNPFWTANFDNLSDHPILNGVEPFTIRDEWYYHMRFQDNMEGVTPILSDLPPAESLSRGDGPHSNNPHVREAVLENREQQHVAWAYKRPNGGRSFGFTGAHYHWNWGHNQFRRVVANAIAWTAGIEIPVNGLQFSPIDALELAEMTDDPIPARWNPEPIQQMLDEANNQ